MYPIKPKAGEKRPRITLRYRAPGNYIAGFHTGTDFGWTRVEEYVRAVWRGRVVTVVRGDRFYGNYVEIQHPDGSRSVYCHLASIRSSIRVGRTVHTGRWLGIMGQTGNATGRHLHYEERHAPYGYYDHREPKLLTKRRPWRLLGWAS